MVNVGSVCLIVAIMNDSMHFVLFWNAVQHFDYSHSDASSNLRLVGSVALVKVVELGCAHHTTHTQYIKIPFGIQETDCESVEWLLENMKPR